MAIFTKVVLEMSNDIQVKGLQRPITSPWYFNWETRVPDIEPPNYTRTIWVKPLCYEELDTCLLNNRQDDRLSLIKFPFLEFPITATEQKFQDAMKGIDGDIVTLQVNKIIPYLTVIFGADYATYKVYQVNTDVTPATITDVTPV